MAEIINITADMDVVETLEGLLQQAREGELRALAFVGVLQDGEVICDGYTSQVRSYAMPVLAGVDILKDRIKFGCIDIPERDRLIEEL